MPSTSGRSFMDSINHNRGLKTGLTAGLVLLGGTLLFSIVRVVTKYNAPDAKKKRNVNKNLVSPKSPRRHSPSVTLQGLMQLFNSVWHVQGSSLRAP